MIGSAMKTWPSDALRRVADAPVEEWGSGGLVVGNGSTRCLYGIAGDVDYYRSPCVAAPEVGFINDNGNLTAQAWVAARQFDRAFRRHGKPRLVRAVKIRALRILTERHPSEVRVRVEALRT